MAIDGRSPFAGATVADLSPRTADRVGLPANRKGVVIMEIARNSTAEQVGLRPGDLVQAVNGREIASAETLRMAARQQTRLWRFTIERDGRQMTQVLRY